MKSRGSQEPAPCTHVTSPWWELFAPVREQLAATEELLADLTAGQAVAVREVFAHTLCAGGKRLRPALVLLCAEACGGAGDKAIRSAAAVELLHSGSLLHDDVFDGSETRRGTESAWYKWGVAKTVLVGDTMAATAYQHLAEAGDNKVLSILAQTVGGMCRAELLSLERSGDLDEAAYLEIVAGKTAGLFSASCRLGALAAGAREDTVAGLAAYGRDVGMAFQITDDLLDLYGDAARLGKSVGQDQARGLLTLAVIHALAHDDSGQIARLVSDLSAGRGGVEQARDLADLVGRAGGRRYAEDRAQAHAASGRTHLGMIPLSPSRTALVRVSERIVDQLV